MPKKHNHNAVIHESIPVQTAPEEPKLDLAIGRTILLNDHGRDFTFHCRRVEPEDWLAFFAAQQITAEQRGDRTIRSQDFDTPFLVLAERVITRTDGYRVAGGLDFHELPEWRQRIPLSHRKQAGIALASVGISAADPEDDFLIHPQGEVVSIDAVWSASETGMIAFTGLKHVLRTPTEQQYTRFNRQASRSIVVGGSRSGKTIFAGAHQTLCELYDELVISVDPAYVFGGHPLLADAAAIRKVMDLHHKFTVAQQVFNPLSTVGTGPAAVRETAAA